MRILGLLKADKHSEAGDPAPPELLERMGKFIQEITAAGTRIAGNSCRTTATAAALRSRSHGLG